MSPKVQQKLYLLSLILAGSFALIWLMQNVRGVPDYSYYAPLKYLQ